MSERTVDPLHKDHAGFDSAHALHRGFSTACEADYRRGLYELVEEGG
jgi:hypothetical protein